MSEPFEVGISIALDDGLIEEMKRARETIDLVQRASANAGVIDCQVEQFAEKPIRDIAPVSTRATLGPQSLDLGKFEGQAPSEPTNSPFFTSERRDRKLASSPMSRLAATRSRPPRC